RCVRRVRGGNAGGNRKGGGGARGGVGGGLAAGDVGAVEGNAPRRWGEEVGQKIEACRLARAVRTDEGVDGPAPDSQTDVLHRQEATKLLGEPLRLEDDVRRHGAGLG